MKTKSLTNEKFCLLMRFFTFILLVTFCVPAFANNAIRRDHLRMSAQKYRFSNIDNKTSLDIVFQIPYEQLLFVNKKYGFEANIKIELFAKRKGKEKLIYTNSANVVTRYEYKTNRPDEFYMDKLSLTLSKSEIKLLLKITDTETNKIALWEEVVEPLTKDDIVGDLELSSFIRKSNPNYYPNFHKSGKLHMVNPSGIFITNNDSIHLYTEIYNKKADSRQFLIETTFTNNQKGSLVIKDTLKVANFNNPYILTVEGSRLTEGYHDITVKILANGKEVATRESFVIMRKEKKQNYRLFAQMKNDVKVISYFLNTAEKKLLSSLDEKNKDKFLRKFWEKRDINPLTKTNEFFEMVRKRVIFTKENFSKQTSGWKSDRGRIYIKYGAPAERVKETTGGSAPSTDEVKRTFAGMLGARDYEIWKYHGVGGQRSYLFFDIQSNGNLKLIHDINDDKELSKPNWKRFMGSDFDENDLR